jgi:hypothetical protein
MTGQPRQALGSAVDCLSHYGRDLQNVLTGGDGAADYRGTMRRLGDVLASGISGAYVPPIDVCGAYLHAGQKELALEWLSKAIDARDPNVFGAIRDPFTQDSLGADSRFHDLVRGTRLPL